MSSQKMTVGEPEGYPSWSTERSSDNFTNYLKLNDFFFKKEQVQRRVNKTLVTNQRIFRHDWKILLILNLFSLACW